MSWLYSLPDAMRRDVIALQDERATAVQLALGMAVDVKKKMSRDEAKAVVDRCTAEIERIYREAQIA